MSTAKPPRPIRDEDAYEETIAEIRSLWRAPEGTPERERLEVLMVLASGYEEENHPIGLPDPIDAIVSSMEEKGMSRQGLGRLLGIGGGHVSEILGRHQRLTVDMVRTLSEALTISLETLVQDYPLVPAPREGQASARTVVSTVTAPPSGTAP